MKMFTSISKCIIIYIWTWNFVHVGTILQNGLHLVIFRRQKTSIYFAPVCSAGADLRLTHKLASGITMMMMIYCSISEGSIFLFTVSSNLWDRAQLQHSRSIRKTGSQEQRKCSVFDHSVEESPIQLAIKNFKRILSKAKRIRQRNIVQYELGNGSYYQSPLLTVRECWYRKKTFINCFYRSSMSTSTYFDIGCRPKFSKGLWIEMEIKISSWRNLLLWVKIEFISSSKKI